MLTSLKVKKIAQLDKPPLSTFEGSRNGQAPEHESLLI